MASTSIDRSTLAALHRTMARIRAVEDAAAVFDAARGLLA